MCTLWSPRDTPYGHPIHIYPMDTYRYHMDAYNRRPMDTYRHPMDTQGHHRVEELEECESVCPMVTVSVHMVSVGIRSVSVDVNKVSIRLPRRP